MSVNRIRTNLTTFGSLVKNTVLQHHRDFDNDDELIAHYADDIKHSVKALGFISSQTGKYTTSHLTRVFRSNVRVTEHFLGLVGGNSLQFDGIDNYYDDFDRLQAQQEIPLVHPKEKQFLIDSVHHELTNYLYSINQLHANVTRSADALALSVKLRVGEMTKYLKQILKLIKKRNEKKAAYDKVHKKVNKLMKKTVPLDEKELKDLDSLDRSLADTSAVYTTYDAKLKSVLPHALALLDEFVEDLVKYILCGQLDIYKDFDQALRYYCVYHGFTDAKYDRDTSRAIQDYESIVDQWELTVTPARLRLESFISIIHDKNPDLLDEQINDADKTLASDKLWTKLTSKMVEKKHKLKSKDVVNGVFTDYLTADPLASFEKYQNENYSRLETYQPSKPVNVDDVRVPQASPGIAPPPLPPRTNTAKFNPHPNRPLPPAPVQLHRSGSRDSFESIRSDSDVESVESTDTSIALTAVSSAVVANSSPEELTRTLVKFYNSAKNDITRAPVPVREKDLNTITPAKLDVYDKTCSVSFRLEQFHKFFDKLLSVSDAALVQRRVLEAKYDFRGVEAGDLTFKKGDKLEILFDFQAVDTLYSRDNLNWLVGMTTGPYSRIGFVPNNYF